MAMCVAVTPLRALGGDGAVGAIAGASSRGCIWGMTSGFGEAGGRYRRRTSVGSAAVAPGPPTRTVALGGGRTLALDDVGDPAGAPVLYLHGTPDSRLARHPDDDLAAAAGVRL